jgi:hypothetical protein
MNIGFRFFILFIFPSIFLAFFDLSSLRTHFRPLPFLSENFGGHGKKVCGRPRTRLAQASAYAQGFRLHSLQRDKTARRDGVTCDADVTDLEQKGKRSLQAPRRPSAWQARLHYKEKRSKRRFLRNQVRSESAFVSLVLCAESQPLTDTNS